MLIFTTFPAHITARATSNCPAALSPMCCPCDTCTCTDTLLACPCSIVFIDEVDKIVASRNSAWRSGDPSSQGVQRDLLPIIEGGWVGWGVGWLDTLRGGLLAGWSVLASGWAGRGSCNQSWAWPGLRLFV